MKIELKIDFKQDLGYSISLHNKYTKSLGNVFSKQSLVLKLNELHKFYPCRDISYELLISEKAKERLGQVSNLLKGLSHSKT